MVNFTVDQIRWLMDFPTNIRNMSVIAHVDHGKSTLTDSLIAAAGIIARARAGETRFMDTRKDEQERTITIKSTGVSLFFAMPHEDLEGGALESAKKFADEVKARKERKVEVRVQSVEAEDGAAVEDAKEEEPAPATESALAAPEATPATDAVALTAENSTPFLINLIDSPGHVDFSSEVTAALRVTDGALVVVDCIEGVCVQTETVLRQAISERIRPVLFVNKLDRMFLEVKADHEEAYQTFSRAIESVNVVIATYKDELLGDVQVYPEKGTVGFGSGLHSWGFTIGRFANMYASKFGVPKEKMMRYLWGDWFFNAKEKKWTTKMIASNGDRLERGFCSFILKPIETLFTAIIEDKKTVYENMLTKLNINLPKDVRELTGKALLKRVMNEWLPAAHALLQMIINHLPSPVVAQKYRVENLYAGPLDDECAKAIRNCDPNGPLMLYVSKMVPTSEKGRFYAFGRIFSGTVASGQTVRIQEPDYQPGKKQGLHIKKVQRTVLMMGRYIEHVPSAPCGNTIGLVGIDAYLLKSGTLSTHKDAHNFVDMKYSVSPVVRVAVEVCNASDLPKLMEGLKRLAKSDPLVQCITTQSGEHVIAGAGELHLEICLKDLREDFMKNAPIRVGQPVVNFCETVKEKTNTQVISKSPNKHNRLYMEAEPLGEDFCKGMDEGKIIPEEDVKVRSRKLADDFKWDVSDARKIWSFGLLEGKPNVIVDMTKGVAYMNEIKDSICSQFQQCTCSGVFCEETMRGVRFNLLDVVLHSDSIHRGAGQMMPATRRAMSACQIKSSPSLLEPLYLCDITVPQHAMAGVYTTLNMRRGIIEGKEDRPGTPLVKIKAYLPVTESFGFTNLLRQNTSGQAFPQMIFSHWQLVNGEIYDEGSMVNKLVMGVRQRKGLSATLPDFNDFYDKL